MNNNTEHDSAMESALENLARSDRAEPDAAFEDRIWNTMQQLPEQRIAGRRRKKSTAWIPFVTLACVGLMGFIVWMPMLSVDMDNLDKVASAPEDDFSADFLLSSFDAMDMLISDADEIGHSLDFLELQIDTNEFELATNSTWQDLGGSL